MSRKQNEDADLAFVSERVFVPNSLSLDRFSRAETLKSRTPDFRVNRGNELVAYCEVKSPRDDWLDEQLDIAPGGQIVGGARSDPTFNRIARHVEKAASQFYAVNQNREALNILAFVNHDVTSRSVDLYETVTGYFPADDGKRYPTMMNIAFRLKSAHELIDLYIWLDAKTERTQYLLNSPDPARDQNIRDLFGLRRN